MKQLSGIDVTFLNMETPTTFGHVASLNLFDATGPAGENVLETTKQNFLDRIGGLEPLRRRLVEVPLGLDLPYWIADPNFDIDFHVRHHAVPPPGTPQQLSEVISRIHARPLDRSRPLWELYVIEGVDEGRVFATFTKVHHAAVDGAAGAIMLAALLDIEPDPPPFDVQSWEPDQIPTDQALLRRTMVEYIKRPEKAIRMTTRAIRELAAASRTVGCGRWPMSSPSPCQDRLATSCAGASAGSTTRSTIRPSCHPPLHHGRRGMRRSVRTDGSPTRRSHSMTPRRSAVRWAARSTTSS